MATQAIKPPKQYEILGAAYYRLGKYAEAKSALIEASKKEDESGYPGETLLFLAMTCCRLGEREEARGWFTRAETGSRTMRPRRTCICVTSTRKRRLCSMAW